MKKIKTLIVDDEPLARERLAALLAGEADIEVVGQCRDGEEAVRRSRIMRRSWCSWTSRCRR